MLCNTTFLGETDEDGNPPSLLDTEEEPMSDELEEHGEEEEMAEAQRRRSGWVRYGRRNYLYVSQRKQWVDAEVTRLLEQQQQKQQLTKLHSE